MGKKMTYKKLRKAAKKLYGDYPILDAGDNQSGKYQDLMEALGMAPKRSLIRTDVIGGSPSQTLQYSPWYNQYQGAPSTQSDSYHPVQIPQKTVTNANYKTLRNLTEYIRFKYTPDIGKVVAEMVASKNLSLYVPDDTLSTEIIRTELRQENCEEGFLDPLYGHPMQLMPRIEMSRHPISDLPEIVYKAYLRLLEDLYFYLIIGMEEEDEEYAKFLDRAANVLHAFLVDYGEIKYYAMKETYQMPGPTGPIATTSKPVETPQNELSGLYIYDTDSYADSGLLHLTMYNTLLYCADLDANGEHKWPEQNYSLLEVSKDYAYNTKLLGVSVYDLNALCKILYEFMEREHSEEMKKILPNAWHSFNSVLDTSVKEQTPAEEHIPAETPQETTEQ